MKRIIALLITLVLVFALASCASAHRKRGFPHESPPSCGKICNNHSFCLRKYARNAFSKLGENNGGKDGNEGTIHDER